MNNKQENTYQFKKIFLSSIIIQAISTNFSNNVFIILLNKKTGIIPSKLFLLHMSICYKNIYLKLSKCLENNEELFALIFNEIFLIPLIHNFDNAFKHLEKKIDFILFGNSEYISSMIIDLKSNEILGDIGFLIQKKYKTSFIRFINKKKILKEISFHGEKLKNNYLKSKDKDLEKTENCIKLEFRTTFPKLLFMVKFFPVLEGIIIVHYFNQYKLSKVQIKNPNNENHFIYDTYKEIDISNFNLFSQIEENNQQQISIIEKFFFEYFIILGNNSKETNKTPNEILTYKTRDYNLLYMNKEILEKIKDIILEYYKDEKDLLYKIKRKIIEENEKNNLNIKNTNTNFYTYRNGLIMDTSINKSERTTMNNNNIFMNKIRDKILSKNPLELGYDDFIREFQPNKITPNNDNNEFIGVSDINIMLPGDYSNVNEYSELNLSKDNIGIIKRNIVTNTRNNNNDEFNIYDNYGIITSETKYLKTEPENGGIPINTNDPFNIDVTSIINNGEFSKEEWGFKSILVDKNKNN